MNKNSILLLMLLLISSAYLPCRADYPDHTEFDVSSPGTLIPNETMIDTGEVVSAKMRSLAAGQTIEFYTATNDIKAIHMADSLPANFAASDANTISTVDSGHPVYIFFDNKNDAGIMYVYSGGYQIVMNPDSSLAFCLNSSLTDISGLSDWDTSHVTSISGIFMEASSLTSLHGLENWNTGNVVDMAGAFYYNTSLTDISALAGWDTSKVNNMCALFMGTSSLANASALTNWNTSNVTDMSYMFSNSISLTSIDVSNWDTGKVTDMDSMFQVGYSDTGNGTLSEIRGLGNWDVSNVTNMTCMFYGAGQMTHYDISNWDVSRVQSFNHMFCNNFLLESLDLSGWNVENVRTMYDMFDDARKLTSIGDVSHWDTTSLVDIGGWLNMACSFVGDNGLLDLSGWDTSSLKAAGEAFRSTSLEIIDLSGWTFDSIINGAWHGAGSGIFYEYGNQFSEIYTGMNNMFSYSNKLSTVYVSQSGLNSFNTAAYNGVNTTDMWNGTLASGFSVKPTSY